MLLAKYCSNTASPPHAGPQSSPSASVTSAPSSGVAPTGPSSLLLHPFALPIISLWHCVESVLGYTATHHRTSLASIGRRWCGSSKCCRMPVDPSDITVSTLRGRLPCRAGHTCAGSCVFRRCAYIALSHVEHWQRTSDGVAVANVASLPAGQVGRTLRCARSSSRSQRLQKDSRPIGQGDLRCAQV